MAETTSNISSNIATASTLREFLVGFQNKGTISSGSLEEGATNVNVIWDGDSYYITYDVVDGDNIITTIADIEGYLPLTITTPAPEDSES